VTSAADFLPPTLDLDSLRAASAGCHGCELWHDATQTVFGEGAPRAHVMLVGEQPGNEEDLAGRPFVGPAGGVLARALTDADIDPDDTWTTNIVKHFRFSPKGKRRLHQKPGLQHVLACRPWLEAEIAAIRPEILVLLGATAAQGVLGRDFRVTRQHGELLPCALAPRALATIHPSAVLRAPDPDARRVAYDQLVADLRVVAAALPVSAAP
jgi:DNA polymerase